MNGVVRNRNFAGKNISFHLGITYGDLYFESFHFDDISSSLHFLSFIHISIGPNFLPFHLVTEYDWNFGLKRFETGFSWKRLYNQNISIPFSCESSGVNVLFRLSSVFTNRNDALFRHGFIFSNEYFRITSVVYSAAPISYLSIYALKISASKSHNSKPRKIYWAICEATTLNLA